jgi:plastocyanin
MVTASTPSTLYYYCSIHSGMGADITIGDDDGY